MNSIEPPAGTGNPLGTAGLRTRLGGCMAGRMLRHPTNLFWARPCGSAADGLVVVSRGEDAEPLLVPLCAWHMRHAPGG